ncbi:hypothetical protein HCZ23_16170 [Celeribacter sp. HF31]|uniref:hypothetical protein n=1 Tax=Celeribacter sp. HF31 TaxID=2721558 RepID=UPI0014314CFD|nr:hypothetical protein [Celeribacter sp. HF31]NIY81001.1 hypothetical protein [Celeribacter sp. HF31]
MRCRSLAYLDTSIPLEQPTVEGATPVTPFNLPEGASCEKCIYMSTTDNIIDAVLVALDAEAGALCQGFGDAGTIDLKQGRGDAQAPLYALTSPPLLAGSTIVVGGCVADNVALDMPGGVMRGFDVPMQPELILGTKAGQIFVLVRASGQSLTKVTEIDVKPANIPG